MNENIDDLIQRMKRAAEFSANESIDSIQARISVVHALVAESHSYGRGALMRAQQLRDMLVPELRMAMREIIRRNGVDL